MAIAHINIIRKVETKSSMRSICAVMAAIVLSLLLTACDVNTVYFRYDHTPVQGWEKNDTLTFDVQPLERPGYYSTTIGLRINDSYPFTSLVLVMEKTVYPNRRIETDTIVCRFTDKEGNSHRQGTSYYQYSFEAGTSQFAPGDSLHVTIRHCMKRDILPGISDIGIRLSKK